MRQYVAIIALALTLQAGMGAHNAAYAQQSQDSRVADLVQAGVLRFALGLGTPTTAIKDPETGELKGAGLEMGRALAARMGVKFTGVEYPRPGAVLDDLSANTWDASFLVFDPQRAGQVNFSNPSMQTDFTYLLRPGSTIRSAAQVDQPGIRIAVPRGDGSDLYLTRTLKYAELIRTESHAAAVQLLRTGGADAKASPRPVLAAESVTLPGARLLSDGFADISFAMVLPKAQTAHLAYVNEFIENAKASGLVQQIIEKVDLQGVRVAPPGKL